MKNGFSLLEIVIVIFIFSLFLIPTTFLISKYQKNLLLNSVVAEITEAFDYARTCAKSEKKNVSVKFEENSFYILKSGKIVDKVYHLPPHIYVKEITAGLNSVVFLPDGRTEKAGHIKIGIENSSREKSIIIHNVTGKCLIK